VLVSRASKQRNSSLDNAAASWALAPGCLVRACTCDRVANAPRRAAEPVLCVVREGAVRPPTEVESVPSACEHSLQAPELVSRQCGRQLGPRARLVTCLRLYLRQKGANAPRRAAKSRS
jgi:hypothetical protein